MRVSFEWVDEDEALPDSHCKVSLARDDIFTDTKIFIGKLMASVMTMMGMNKKVIRKL